MVIWWFKLIKKPTKELEWVLEDIEGELTEFRQARGVINKWSELSDVVGCYDFARYSGHVVSIPFNKLYILIGSVYMVPKLSLRLLLFWRAGKKVDRKVSVKEYRNPKKIEKLQHIANKYNIDPIKFQIEVEKRLKYWPLLR